ncbi:hypothetical protein [Polyangium spumosum]|uniref:Uncharacterized protein n=1 Tax=Polyangium spumosum TaxID=889282 RepID=A0A6N7Q0S1_9BACT|nr:hypothetical protein [Polyangium spumosum]MRG96135.1 hypothetical protein [Polyangium spumosum]
MSARHVMLALGVSTILLAGCGSGFSAVEPRVLAPHELTLRYDNEFQVHSPQGVVATGVRYRGLVEYVGCVPDAERHALAAESAGDTAVGLTVAGLTLGVGGAAGLAGLAFQDNPELMWGLMLGGLGAEVLGLVLTGVGRATRIDAHGHAVDAMNYYNDAVGSLGGRCGPRGAEMPRTQYVDAPAPPTGPIYPVPVQPGDAPPVLPPVPPAPETTPEQPADLPPERIILDD